MDIDTPEWLQDDAGLVTHYVKIYPDRIKVILFKSPYNANPIASSNSKAPVAWLTPPNDDSNSLANSLQRAKTRLSDLVICNDFDLFVTFTLNCRACIPKCDNQPCTCDKAVCVRYNLDYAIRTMKGWYNNFSKNYRTFPRVQVMELHKDGGYHFHALFKEYPGNLRVWTKGKDGRQIYTLTSYQKGWSTAKKIYDISGASSYIRKYLTKDMPLFPGKKRYWSSQGLKRPIIIQDHALASKVLIDPRSKTWSPEETDTTSNVESITTLMVDNKQNYEHDLEILSSLDDVTKATKD